MIPEHLKMGHWLGEVPLPFAFSRSPRVQKANKGHKMYLGFENDPRLETCNAGEYLRGMVRYFYKVGPLQAANEVISYNLYI